MKIKERIIRGFKRGLNPIVVKELRQAVRSRFVIGILMFFLLFLVGGTGVTLLITSVNNATSSASQFGAGKSLFTVLFSVLMVVCTLFIPIYVAVRLGTERDKDGVDLFFITTLSPAAIVRGKFFSALLLVALLFSVCMPFMTLTYLLRGIDLPTIFLILISGFIFAIMAVHTAILFSCLPLGKIFKIITGIVLIFLCVTVLPGLIFSISIGGGSSLFSGSINFGSWEFWRDALIFITMASMLLGFMNVFSTMLLSPPTANRALPVRIYSTSIWLLSWIIISIAFFLTGSAPYNDIVMIWLGVTTLFLSAALLTAVNSNENLSYRVRAAIPRKRILRILSFPFFSGPMNGLVWAVMLMVASFFMAGIIQPDIWDKNASAWMSLFIYFYAYALSATFIRRTILKRLPCGNTWIIALLMMMLISILPLIGVFFIDGFEFNEIEGWCYGNPFALGDDINREMQILIGSFWALSITIINWRWIFSSTKRFASLPPPLLKENGQ